MIRAVFDKKGFFIEGHAEYEEYGKDIVCAAVSSMTLYAANLLALKGAKIEKKRGKLSVRIGKENEFTQLILKTLIAALRDVERKFPEHIKVEVM